MGPTKNPTPDLADSVSLENPVKPSVPREAGEILEVEKILKGKNRVNLLHRGEVYRLQVTKQGRLLLTK
ncbi:MAG: hemin uptake protein HemP [Nitrospinota bacterium]